MLFFLVIVCLRSFCSYDSPRPSSSMKLSPSFRTPLSLFPFLPIFLFLLDAVLFLPIPLHLYCRCNPRYSAELSLPASRLFPSVAARNCRSRDSLESRKNASVFPSILQHHLSRSGYNSAEHLPSGFHCSPFFRFAPSISLHQKQFILKPFRPRSHQIPYNIPKDARGTPDTKGNNF